MTCHADRVSVTRVVRDAEGPPRVDLFDTRSWEGSLGTTLGALRREHRLDRCRITALLPHGEYQFQTIDAPPVPDAELKSAVRWRLQDLMDYPPDEAAVDVLPVPQGPGAARTPQVVAVWTRNAHVTACIRRFDDAGLGLEAIDVQETVQRNVASLLQADDRAIAVLGITPQGGLLTITRDAELYLARTLDLGVAVNAAIDDATAAPALERVVLDVQRSLDHFDRQFGGIPVARLLVAPCPRADALRAALAESLYVPVEALDLSGVIDFSAAPALQDPLAQARHLPLIGAALRSA